MRNRQLAQGKLRRALPSIVLAMLAATMIMATTAGADDPPIVSVGPVSGGETDVSGSAGSDPEVDACIGDDHSGAGPDDPGLVALNDSSCQSSGGPSAGSMQPSGSTGTSSTSSTSSVTNRSSTLSSVAAADAIGLRIVGVRKLMKNVRLIRNFRVVVTVKDTRGLRVRGAIVSVSGVPGSRSTVSGIHAGFSNKVGQARVLVPVTKSMFGKRLYVKIAARTPKARAVALRSVFLPRLR